MQWTHETSSAECMGERNPRGAMAHQLLVTAGYPVFQCYWLATTLWLLGVPASNWLLTSKVTSSSSLQRSSASFLLLVVDALPLKFPFPGSWRGNGGSATGTSVDIKHRLSGSSLMARRWWLPLPYNLGSDTWKRSTPTSACLDFSVTRMQGGRDSPADAVAKSRNFCQSLWSKRSAKELPGSHESTRPCRRLLPTILNCWSKRTSPDEGIGSGQCMSDTRQIRNDLKTHFKCLMPPMDVMCVSHNHAKTPSASPLSIWRKPYSIESASSDLMTAWPYPEIDTGNLSE